MTERREISVQGIVQGVGFRPFVYGLAQKNHLAGFVRNHSAGVTMELEGETPALDRFLETLSESPPPLARIERITSQAILPKGEAGFTIVESTTADERQVAIAPDAATCADCLHELFDPADRRYRYPFINCTQCGPRFTISMDVPYDRARTTMAAFQMCAACDREYRDPASRRFHAQPNACAVCGPRMTLRTAGKSDGNGEDALARAAALLREGKILAIKGLGGYHLACNALDDDAVGRLRRNKHREDKPFALMAPHLNAIQQICAVSPAEEALLCSRQRPIVLLPKRMGCPVSAAVAPGQQSLGVMLPYTPLHHLLLSDCAMTLVMTSGNVSDEPIAFDDTDACERLGDIADSFLIHDRPIYMRCDDSVARVAAGRAVLVRRARGYAPAPLSLTTSVSEQILAYGAELKNTFCLAKGTRAFLSHHIGDLSNYAAYRSYVEGIDHYQRLFDIHPTVIAHDLHPQYLSTQYALQISGVKRIAVQHHHAHIASCMAENHLTEPVIGVAFDGLGYGSDGAIWGGEFLLADLRGYERLAHLRYVALAGGDAAIRRPWRSALSYLRDALGCDRSAFELPGWQAIAPKEIELAQAMIDRGINAVRTSSCGRLFDTVASIIGLRQEINYEGQAAIELEACATAGVEDRYSFEIAPTLPSEIDFRSTIAEIVTDVHRGVARGVIAAKFHNAVAAAIVVICRRLRQNGAPRRVCLGGGAFQNVYLLKRLLPTLASEGFEVFCNAEVPANDGGIAFGQMIVANEIMRRGE